MIPIFKLERERSKERDTDGRRTERQRKRLYDVRMEEQRKLQVKNQGYDKRIVDARNSIHRVKLLGVSTRRLRWPFPWIVKGQDLLQLKTLYHENHVSLLKLMFQVLFNDCATSALVQWPEMDVKLSERYGDRFTRVRTRTSLCFTSCSFSNFLMFLSKRSLFRKHEMWWNFKDVGTKFNVSIKNRPLTSHLEWIQGALWHYPSLLGDLVWWERSQ